MYCTSSYSHISNTFQCFHFIPLHDSRQQQSSRAPFIMQLFLDTPSLLYFVYPVHVSLFYFYPNYSQPLPTFILHALRPRLRTFHLLSVFVYVCSSVLALLTDVCPPFSQYLTIFTCFPSTLGNVCPSFSQHLAMFALLSLNTWQCLPFFLSTLGIVCLSFSPRLAMFALLFLNT
jgi:hypothetical protein